MSRKAPVEAEAAPSFDDPFAKRLRGFGPIGILAILVILLSGNVLVGRMVALPVGALLVLAWVWRSGTPRRETGFVRPRSWTLTLATGLAFGVAFKFLMKAIVMPLLGADPINPSYHFLAGNRRLLPAAIYTMIVGAGFGEETLFRGFLFERLGKLFGQGAGAKTLVVLLTAVVFGLVHYSDQGLAGAEQATIVGLVFGMIMAITGRIWMLMCAHAAFDLTALAMIYWGFESAVPHLVFN